MACGTDAFPTVASFSRCRSYCTVGHPSNTACSVDSVTVADMFGMYLASMSLCNAKLGSVSQSEAIRSELDVAPHYKEATARECQSARFNSGSGVLQTQKGGLQGVGQSPRSAFPVPCRWVRKSLVLGRITLLTARDLLVQVADRSPGGSCLGHSYSKLAEMMRCCLATKDPGPILRGGLPSIWIKR